MTRTKKLSDQLLKYAEEKIHQRSLETTERLKRYLNDLSTVSKELTTYNKMRVFNKHLSK